jgi:hypothetical protein
VPRNAIKFIPCMEEQLLREPPPECALVCFVPEEEEDSLTMHVGFGTTMADLAAVSDFFAGHMERIGVGVDTARVYPRRYIIPLDVDGLLPDVINAIPLNDGAEVLLPGDLPKLVSMGILAAFYGIGGVMQPITDAARAMVAVQGVESFMEKFLDYRVELEEVARDIYGQGIAFSRVSGWAAELTGDFMRDEVARVADADPESLPGLLRFLTRSCPLSVLEPLSAEPRDSRAATR